MGEIWSLILDKLNQVVKYAVGYTSLKFKRVIRVKIKIWESLAFLVLSKKSHETG